MTESGFCPTVSSGLGLAKCIPVVPVVTPSARVPVTTAAGPDDRLDAAGVSLACALCVWSLLFLQCQPVGAQCHQLPGSVCLRSWGLQKACSRDGVTGARIPEFPHVVPGVYAKGQFSWI